jgi:hypothetical protein
VVKKNQLADVRRLDELIREVRGQKIMLDFDLARVYGVETKSLNRAVKRNALRCCVSHAKACSQNRIALAYSALGGYNDAIALWPPQTSPPQKS